MRRKIQKAARAIPVLIEPSGSIKTGIALNYQIDPILRIRWDRQRRFRLIRIGSSAFIAMWLAVTLHASRPMAQEYSAGQLVIAHPWTPPTLGKQRIAVVYFTVRNPGPEAERLLGVDLPEGGQARMHTSEMQNGVMRMRPVDEAMIPAGGELVLQPGGMHVMLNALPGPLITGNRLKLKLRFEKAGQVDVEAAIKLRADMPGKAHPAH